MRPTFLAASFAFLIVALVLASACGVKGPPLPPLASTPEQSDRMENRETRPSPSPTGKRVENSTESSGQ